MPQVKRRAPPVGFAPIPPFQKRLTLNNVPTIINPFIDEDGIAFRIAGIVWIRSGFNGNALTIYTGAEWQAGTLDDV